MFWEISRNFGLLYVKLLYLKLSCKSIQYATLLLNQNYSTPVQLQNKTQRINDENQKQSETCFYIYWPYQE